MEDKPKKKAFYIEVDEKLYYQIKEEALKHRLKINELFLDAVTTYLAALNEGIRRKKLID